MYPLRRLRQIRELEFFLFRGVPETPEQVFERDSNAYVGPRTTRRPLAAVSTEYASSRSAEDDGTGYIEFDLATGELRFVAGSPAQGDK